MKSSYKIKTENDKQTPCEISNILEKFGPFQTIQCVLICLPITLISMGNINYAFLVGDIDYRCRVDKCEDANSTAKHPSWWPDTNIDRCSTPVLRSEEQVCTNNSFTGELAACDHWIYESNDTVVAEFDLACHPWKSNVIGTVHNLVMLISMPLFGWISDKIGRKPILVFSGVAGCVGYFKTLASSYYIYVFIEGLEAFVTGGMFACSMALLLECTGKKHRPMSGAIFTYSIFLGEIIFACIAAFVPYWKYTASIIYVPCALLIFNIFLLNESPRWQIVNGRYEEAKIIMKRIAEMNKISINTQELESIDDIQMKEKYHFGTQEVKEGFIDIFLSKEIIKRMIVTSACRFTTRFVYYGLMLDAVWLPGNKYLNFFLTTLMSFPGEGLSLYLVYKVGRKMPLLTGYSLCGVLCIISAFTPANYHWVKLSAFLLGKILIAACYSSVITYSMELFPTSVRGSLLGISGFASRLGGTVAPLTPVLNTVSDGLPFILFGCSAFITSLLLSLTPETKDLPLFDTIQQVENYYNNDCSTEAETKNV